MRFLKKLLPIALIFGAVTAGIFIVGRYSQRAPSIATLSYEAAAGRSFYELTPTANQTESLESLGATQNSASLAGPAFNFTRDIAKKIALELIGKNNQDPSLLASGRINAIKPDEVVNSFLDEELKKIDYQKFIPEINYRDLKISSAGAKTDLEKYFRDSQIIIKRNLIGLGITASLFNETDIVKIIQALSRASQGLRELSVPLQLMTLHGREINLLTAQKNIFEAISNYRRDPLNAFTAFQSLGLITDEFNKLRQEFQEFALRNNLSF